MIELAVAVESNPTLDRGRVLMDRWRRAMAGGPGLGFDAVNIIEKQRARQFGSKPGELPPVPVDDPEVEAVERALCDLRVRDWKLWQVAMDVHLKGRTLRDVKRLRPVFGATSVTMIKQWSDQALVWIVGRVDG